MKKEETGLDRARIDCALRCRNEIPLLQVFLMFLILIVLSKVEIPYPAYGSSGGKSQFHFIDARQGIDPDRDTAVLDRTDADISEPLSISF